MVGWTVACNILAWLGGEMKFTHLQGRDEFQPLKLLAQFCATLLITTHTR